MNTTIISIAWRNVWRNKLRSIIIICAVSVGLIGGLFYYGFALGMMNQRVESAIRNEISNLQIHHPEYLLNEEVKNNIQDPDNISQLILKYSEVKAVSQRIKATAMISTAETGTGVILNGVTPDHEKQVTGLSECIDDGEFLNNESRIPIIIGRKLATKLSARLKSKVVITAANTEGVITYGAFQVIGIYDTDNDMFDEVNVFVRKNDLTKLLKLDQSHTNEIAIALYNHDDTKKIGKELNQMFLDKTESEQLTIRTWQEIVPSLNAMIEMMDYFAYVFLIIILFALAFGIVNTMLMVVMERIKEIGMLKAIGMTNTRIFRMIMLETIFLSGTGGIIGLFLSILCIEYFGYYGFSLEDFQQGFNSLGFSAIIYPEGEVSFYISTTLLVIITAIISSIYPARKALKMKAVEAIKTDH
ncbi:MAG: ABC transporter permease [Bacteroidetes bacterium]|nr:ABC transporter permease [Bacteroidota bacterium]